MDADEIVARVMEEGLDGADPGWMDLPMKAATAALRVRGGAASARQEAARALYGMAARRPLASMKTVEDAVRALALEVATTFDVDVQYECGRALAALALLPDVRFVQAVDAEDLVKGLSRTCVRPGGREVFQGAAAALVARNRAATPKALREPLPALPVEDPPEPPAVEQDEPVVLLDEPPQRCPRCGHDPASPAPQAPDGAIPGMPCAPSSAVRDGAGAGAVEDAIPGMLAGRPADVVPAVGVAGEGGIPGMPTLRPEDVVPAQPAPEPPPPPVGPIPGTFAVGPAETVPQAPAPEPTPPPEVIPGAPSVRPQDTVAAEPVQQDGPVVPIPGMLIGRPGAVAVPPAAVPQPIPGMISATTTSGARPGDLPPEEVPAEEFPFDALVPEPQATGPTPPGPQDAGTAAGMAPTPDVVAEAPQADLDVDGAGADDQDDDPDLDLDDEDFVLADLDDDVDPADDDDLAGDGSTVGDEDDPVDDGVDETSEDDA